MEDNASAAAQVDAPASADPTRVADRYDVQQLLGRGGMASAYRALDSVTGKVVALKVLTAESNEKSAARSIELFEREFHTLVQLAHPRVVQAHDYGVDDGKPYYTMELLDGGDLQALAPMPWQEVAVVAYEICSALSLLHSRRLVHRDLTPRNIRRTADGKAKLIDFGLLSPMGPAVVVAGTPPFAPPELINSVSLDGRSDLFSLGATLYFVLTGRLAYPARRFDRLRDAWRTSPAAPSKIVAGIPTGLDDILLAMLRIDAGSRPRSAAEVMDRLLPLLERAPDEDLRVANAYLSVPGLVGRDAAVVRFRKAVLGAVRRKGGGFVIAGEEGVGRSRMLDAFVLEAKLAGATTIRADATSATRAFGVAAALAAQLHDASPAASLKAARSDSKVHALLFGDSGSSGEFQTVTQVAPSLVDITRSDLDRAAVQVALRTWLLEFANQRPLAIAVDDVDEIDEPSAALLASLTWEAPKHRLVYAVALESSERSTAPIALGVIRKHAEAIELLPLDLEQTTRLLASVFGETANLQLLSRRLQTLCGGRPRECMTLAQYLVDQGAITYAGGSWTLPGELAEGLLPASIAQNLSRQVTLLSPTARRLVAFVASGLTERLSRTQLIELEGGSPKAIDAALDELSAVRLLTGDTSGYMLRHGSLARLLTSTLSDEERVEIHRRLAEVQLQSNANPLVVAYHELLGPRPQEGLDFVLDRAGDTDARSALTINATDNIGPDRTGRTLELALREAERSQRRRRDLQALWVMLAGVSAQGEDAAYYYRVPPAWLDQLKQDSGWNDWQNTDPSLEPAVRAMMALGAASMRYAETPDNERVLSPPETIKQLVSYVVFSIAVSVRVIDLPLMASLPILLEPFAPLNPLVAAMLANARGTLLNGQGKREAAREAFLGVLSQLDAITGAELAYVDKVRASLSQTLAEIDASLGIASFWVERLGHDTLDTNQEVGGSYVRKVAALHQGDWEAAEAHRQRAELLTLQSLGRPMFSTLGQELEAHALARDLTGLKQVRAGIHAMAERHPGWLPVMHVSDAHYHRLCGDLEGALAAARSGRAAGDAGPARSPWAIQATTLETEILAELGRPAEALLLGENTLAECERDGMRYLARGLSCAIAEAEAKLSLFERAAARVDRVITEQVALGVTGLQLGHSYELGARIAIAANDIEAFRKLCALTAEQYRPGESSVLGALYERLMETARRAGMGAAATIPPAPPVELLRQETSRGRVVTAMTGCTDRHERMQRALYLLCDGEPPSRGHLLLQGENGLELVASNAPTEGLTGLVEFASNRVELELGEASNVTALVVTASEETRCAEAQWQGPDGARYDAVLLGASLSDGFRLIGVAVLTDEGARGREENFANVAEALARALLESGDTRGIRAA